jgi:predicted glycosyltransferase
MDEEAVVPEIAVAPKASSQNGHSPRAATTSSPKILLYSHDTFGLGNIRRTLLLSETLIDQYPDASALIVTGSPMIHAFRIPDRVDYVKIPCVDRTNADRYEPRFLSACADEVRDTRSAIIKRTVLGFDPDLMIVDKRPGGVGGELIGTLQALRRCRRSTRLVLGVRDILDEPDRTRASFRNGHVFEMIERYYDEVWIYGTRTIFDPIAEYEYPETIARKTRFCGYLKRPVITAHRNGGPPHVLVTTGGGGDGSAMIEAYLEGLMSLPRRFALRTTVVFGPEMPTERRTVLRSRFGCLADVTFVDFEADLSQRYAEADVVVSMAGYNTVCELFSFGLRAVLVPRAEPVREQLIRARLLAERGYFGLVEPHELGPEVLLSRVLTALAAPPPPAFPIDMEGLPRIRERVRSLLDAHIE